jgi:hypothetical protein
MPLTNATWLSGPTAARIAAILGTAVAISSLIWLPALLAPIPTNAELSRVADPAKRIELRTAAVKNQNDVRGTILQAIGGSVLAIGAIATWRQLQTGRQQLKVSQDVQVTDRFTQAVDQLGSQSVDVRIGGIHALTRIARDSPGDAGAIGQILSSFVKVHSPWLPADLRARHHPDTSTPREKRDVASALTPLRTRMPDVQAAMSALGAMHFRRDAPSAAEGVVRHTLGLGGVDLSFADLRGLDLRGVWLAESNLTRAELEGADLRGASLWRSLLSSALLVDADLRGADLRQANLRGAWLQRTRLARILVDAGTDLADAKTEGAIYDDA